MRRKPAASDTVVLVGAGNDNLTRCHRHPEGRLLDDGVDDNVNEGVEDADTRASPLHNVNLEVRALGLQRCPRKDKRVATPRSVTGKQSYTRDTAGTRDRHDGDWAESVQKSAAPEARTWPRELEACQRTDGTGEEHEMKKAASLHKPPPCAKHRGTRLRHDAAHHTERIHVQRPVALRDIGSCL